MPPTRRTLLHASALGFAASFAGYAGAGASANRQETETTTDTTTTDATTTESAAETTAGEGDSLPFTVAVTTHPEYGVILTDSEGMTLYLFTQDEGGESTCYDDCADAWPPLTVEESPTVPDGLPGAFDTTERDDGSSQVTYDGMPLYYWQGDQQPGDATGHGVNDVWFVVTPACPGEAETTAAEATTTADATTTAEAGATEEATTAEGEDGGDGESGDGGGDGESGDGASGGEESGDDAGGGNGDEGGGYDGDY